MRDGKSLKAPETVHRAMIFPLKGNTDGLRFGDFAHDYNVVEGVGRGSLFHYLMTVHSAGFAVCDKADSAIALDLATAYAETTAQMRACVVDQTTGEVWSAFTFEALMSRLSTQPRTTGGKDTSFTAPLVSVEWCKTLYGHGDLAKLAIFERGHLIALAEHLAGEYESWPEFCKDKPRALGVIGEFLAARFHKTPPNLVARYETLPRRPKEIAKAPIAFVGRPSLHGNDKYAPHRVVAQLLAEGMRSGLDAKKAAGAVNDALVGGQQMNGLSWLFGAGLAFFRDAEPRAVVEAFGMPQGRLGDAERIVAAARAIPAPRLFGLEHFRSYRSLVGQKLMSWASNYQNRLASWLAASETMTGKPIDLPQALWEPQAANLFSRMDVPDADFLARSLADLHALAGRVRDYHLPRVQGRSAAEELATDADLEAIERFIGAQVATGIRVNLIINRLEQEIFLAGRAGGEDARQSFFERCRFYEVRRPGDSLDDDDAASNGKVRPKLPDWLQPLEKNLGISGGIPDVAQEMTALAGRINHLMDSSAKHLQRITTWLHEHGGARFDPVAAFVRREAIQVQRAGRSFAEEEAVLRAHRRMLQLFLRQVRLCPRPIQELVAKNLIDTGVIEPRLINQFLFNALRIQFYVGVYERSRHSAVALDDAKLVAVDWMAWIDAQIDAAWEQLSEQPHRDMQMAVVRLMRTAMAIRLVGIPDMDYPLALATPEAGCDLELGERARMDLCAETVRAETISTVLRAYHNALNDQGRKLFRPSFVIKARLRREGNKALLYVPRVPVGGKWRVPEGWVANGGKTPLAALVTGKLGLTPDQRDLDVYQALAQVLAEPLDDAAREFLRQLPHEWRFDTDLDAGRAVVGYPIDRDTKKAGAKLAKGRQFRAFELQGSIPYKSVLDLGLLSDERISWGDLTLNAEQEWAQTPTVKDRRFALKAHPVALRLSVTVAIEETPRDTQSLPDSMHGFVDRAVAIDLGERSLGYAVYDCRTGQCIEAPVRPMPVPQIGALARMAARVERSIPGRQKFAAKFDNRMEMARESAVGAVVRQINALCAKYKAWPILEFNPGSRDTQRDIAKAYEAVQKHFLFSGVQEHKTFRARFWYLPDRFGDSLSHPYLKVVKKKAVVDADSAALAPGKKGKLRMTKTVNEVIEPLNLYPGASVGAAGTSQRDSHCGRNAFEILAEYKEPVFYSKGGRVKLRDGSELLLEAPGPGGWRPIQDGKHDLFDLKRLMTQSMRRPQRANGNARVRRGEDTTVSLYCCIFADCGHQMHADQNAAINIGWKFFNTKVRADA